MKKILELISEEMQQAFEKAGYEKEAGKVTLSNRPDLCEYQCNGAMALAKKYKNTPHHLVELITDIREDGTILTRGERAEAME